MRLVLGALAATVLVGAPVAALTETGGERRLKERLGLVEERPGCWKASDVPGWSEGPPLIDVRDEPRAAVVGGRVYLAGGIEAIVDFGDPSDVPGVAERVEVRSSAALTRFDPATGAYEDLPPLPERLNHIGFAAREGRLVVVGGHGNLLLGADARARAYVFDVASRRWDRLPDMPTARGAVAAGFVGDRLVVAGGMARGRPLRTVEVFDFRTRRWSEAAPMSVAREHVSAASVGGHLYVVGGRSRSDDSLGVAERYDVRRDRWERLPDLPVPTGGGEAVAVDGTIVVMGGGDDRERYVLPDVQRYDIAGRRWSKAGRMRTPRHGFAAAVVGDRVWTFGGSNCPLFSATDTVEVLDIDALGRS